MAAANLVGLIGLRGVIANEMALFFGSRGLRLLDSRKESETP
jgi:hypothetical protein